MEKKKTLDTILKKLYKHIRNEVIPSKHVCPDNHTFWRFVHKELNNEEKEELEGHLLSCPECLEKLEIIKKIEETELSTFEVPEELCKKAREILYKGNEEDIKKTEDEKIRKKITLIWDKIHDKINQVAPKIGEIITSSKEFGALFTPEEYETFPEKPEFQIARQSHEVSQTFPFITTIKSDKGKLTLEINRSGKHDYLTMKIIFCFAVKKILTNVWGRLYKSNRIYSSVNLNDKGEAFFPRIKEGEYCLKFFEGERLLEKIIISILIKKNED